VDLKSATLPGRASKNRFRRSEAQVGIAPAATAPARETLLASLAYSIGGRSATICTNLVSTSWLAYSLRTENFGVNTFALAFLSYFQLIVGLGYDQHLTREIAHDPGRMRPLVESAFAVRLVLAVVAAVLVGLALAVMQKDPVVTGVIVIHAIGLFTTAIGLTSVYQGLQQMRLVALREFGASFVGMVGIVIWVHGPGDVTKAAAILALTSLLMSLMVYARFAREFGRVRLRLPRHEDWAEIRLSLTYFWSAVMVTITYSLHLVLLGQFGSDSDVGLFGAAWKLFVFAIVLPNLTSSLFMPRMADKGMSAERRATACLLFMDTISLSTVPITVLGAVLAPWVVGLLFGPDFLPVTPVVVVLMANALVVSLNIGLGTPLAAVGRQKDFLRVVGVGAALGVVLNLMLIPPFGPMGAGLGTLADEIVILVMLLLDRPEVPLQKATAQFARCLLAAVPAAAVALWMAQSVAGGAVAAVSVAAGGAAGGLVYLAAVILLGTDFLSFADTLRHWPHGSSEAT
jgi:O-antigen/teichoic acid export membrane protein